MPVFKDLVAQSGFDDLNLFAWSRYNTVSGDYDIASEKITWSEIKVELNNTLKTLYNADGTTSGNRLVTLGGSLTFDGDVISQTINSSAFVENIKARNTSSGSSAFTSFIAANDVNGQLQTGIKGSLATAFSGYGAQGDTFIYSSNGSKNLVITNASGDVTKGHIVLQSTNGNVGIEIATPSEKLHVNGNARVDDGLIINGAGSNQFTVSDSINFSQFGNTTQLTDEIVRVGGGLRATGFSVGNDVIQGNYISAPTSGGYAIGGSAILRHDSTRGLWLKANAGLLDQITLRVAGSLDAFQLTPNQIACQTLNASAGNTLIDHTLEFRGHYWNGANQQTVSKIVHNSVDVAGKVSLDFDVKGTVNASIDDDTTAGNTRMLIYDVDNGTLERVSVGAADSGGVGFKVLRIQN